MVQYRPVFWIVALCLSSACLTIAQEVPQAAPAEAAPAEAAPAEAAPAEVAPAEVAPAEVAPAVPEVPQVVPNTAEMEPASDSTSETRSDSSPESGSDSSSETRSETNSVDRPPSDTHSYDSSESYTYDASDSSAEDSSDDDWDFDYSTEGPVDSSDASPEEVAAELAEEMRMAQEGEVAEAEWRSKTNIPEVPYFTCGKPFIAGKWQSCTYLAKKKIGPFCGHWTRIKFIGKRVGYSCIDMCKYNNYQHKWFGSLFPWQKYYFMCARRYYKK